MKILAQIIEKADDTLKEIEWYAEKAHHLKEEKKHLADVYIKVADMHITIYDMLHTEIVELINQQKQITGEPPAEMKAIWNYEHERMVKRFNENKFLVESYKKSY